MVKIIGFVIKFVKKKYVNFGAPNPGGVVIWADW
jgi:hypothetical protein